MKTFRSNLLTYVTKCGCHILNDDDMAADLPFQLIDGLVVDVHRPMTHRGIAMSFAAEPRTVGSTVLDNPYVKATPGSCGSKGR